jgi:hypothetical protein
VRGLGGDVRGEGGSWEGEQGVGRQMGEGGEGEGVGGGSAGSTDPYGAAEASKAAEDEPSTHNVTDQRGQADTHKLTAAHGEAETAAHEEEQPRSVSRTEVCADKVTDNVTDNITDQERPRSVSQTSFNFEPTEIGPTPPPTRQLFLTSSL